MNGFDLIGRLTDHWRKHGTAAKPVIFVLDEGGRQRSLSLTDIRTATTPSGIVTVLEFRRRAQ